ncbi:MAG TPA: hypothetical protein VFS42_04775 [Burkholderiaceae bacterium]|nr:hypothetical protein [Burkholderiaceae bacterium]
MRSMTCTAVEGVGDVGGNEVVVVIGEEVSGRAMVGIVKLPFHGILVRGMKFASAAFNFDFMKQET